MLRCVTLARGYADSALSGIRWSIHVASSFAECAELRLNPLAYPITAQAIHRPFKDCFTSFQPCAARCDSLFNRYPSKNTRFCQVLGYKFRCFSLNSCTVLLKTFCARGPVCVILCAQCRSNTYTPANRCGLQKLAKARIHRRRPEPSPRSKSSAKPPTRNYP